MGRLVLGRGVAGGTDKQLGFCRYLDQIDSPAKTYLNAGISPAKLKEEVLALLRPDTRALPAANGKPRVYLIYNSRDRAEAGNAGLIRLHYDKEFISIFRTTPASIRCGSPVPTASCSSGAPRIEGWCSREFAEMVQSSRAGEARGLCLFDPKETKIAVLEQIRESYRDLCVAEEFGKFDPVHLDPFFNPLRRRLKVGQP